MVRSLLFFCLALGATFSARSQSVTAPTEKVGIIYNRETTVNLKLATNRAFILGFEFGRLRTYYKTTYYHISLGELKHVKEQRQSAEPQRSQSFRPYIYGKQNNVFMFRGGWGVKRYYSEKAKHKGVAVGAAYAFGPSVAMLKPYYLALCYPDPNPNNPECRIFHEKYSSENANLFLDTNGRIKGASPFTKGFGELSFMPGINASLAFHLDWGAFDEFVKAIEIGTMVDVFAKKVPIMLTEENSQVFLNFFINLQLGKRR